MSEHTQHSEYYNDYERGKVVLFSGGVHFYSCRSVFPFGTVGVHAVYTVTHKEALRIVHTRSEGMPGSPCMALFTSQTWCWSTILVHAGVAYNLPEYFL